MKTESLIVFYETLLTYLGDFIAEAKERGEEDRPFVVAACDALETAKDALRMHRATAR